MAFLPRHNATLLLAFALLVLPSTHAFFLRPRSPRHHVLHSSIGPAPGPAPGPSPPPPPPSKGILTVLGPEGQKLTTLEVKPGANLRKTLQGAKVDVYDFVGKISNCNGAGQCGTCVVKLESKVWGPRSEYEAEKIKKGKKYGEGEEYRLACQTVVEGGEATVTLRPPKKK